MPTTFVVEVDFAESPLDRPAYRLFEEATDAETAAAKVARRLKREKRSDVVRRATALDEILAPVRARIASGVEYVASWKSEEGSFGPLVLIDVEAAASAPRGIPFGTEPTYMVVLPWIGRNESQALASSLGVDWSEA